MTLGSFVENGVLELLVSKKMPKLSRHLAREGWTLPSFTHGWYSTVFTSNLQPEVRQHSYHSCHSYHGWYSTVFTSNLQPEVRRQLCR